jgi:pimeloyl-ACP methyl ester carboxylesterase
MSDAPAHAGRAGVARRTARPAVPLPRAARLGVTLLTVALLAACQRHSAPAGAAGDVAPPGTAATAVADEGPRIAMSPDNVHIEYRVYGHGDPAVLLVHGWAADANYWHEQLPALRQRYTVVALNLAGHGASGSNRSDWSIANYAQDVAAVARQVPNPHLILVGHSMGAAVALAAEPLLEPRVLGVVAVEALRSVGEAPPSAAQIEQRLAPFRTDFVGETRKLVTSALFGHDANPALVQKVAYDMSLEPPEVGVASMRALLGTNLASVLPAVHVPVYAINSDQLPTDAARIRKLLPDFNLDVLQHTDHFLMLAAPARFNPLLLKDLEALSARAAH